MFSLPSHATRPSPLEQGDGMKHRKSSQRQKPAERRERKRKPRETPFPLPPTPIPVPIPWHDMVLLHQQALARNDFLAQLLGGAQQSEHLLPRTKQRDYRPFADWQGPKVICEMERA